DRPRGAEAAQPVFAAFETECAACDPRRQARADSDLPERHVYPRLRRAGEIAAVKPDPAGGVLGAPVVPHHPVPAAEVDRTPALELEDAVEARERRWARQLRAWQRRAVEQARAQMAQLRRL